jgi:hypothetical protein
MQWTWGIAMPDQGFEGPYDVDPSAQPGAETDGLFTEARRRTEYAHEAEREHFLASVAQRDARIHGLEAIVSGFLKASDERLRALAALRCERDNLIDELEALRRAGATGDIPERAALLSERDAARAELAELAQARDLLQLALDDAESAARDVSEQHAVERARWQADQERVREAAPVRNCHASLVPILVRDLARWSAPTPRHEAPSEAGTAVVRATPVMDPPSADDLATVDGQIAMLHALIQTPAVDGRPLHAQFDEARFQILQAKLREASILADRLLAQVNRSKSSKDMLWHLMVAHRTDELRRDKRR